MSYDLFRRVQTTKNYAIVGHPPIHSHEYVMAGGGYAPAPARTPSRSSTDALVVDELKIPAKGGIHLYEISNTDWDAAQRWMQNLTENVAYTRRVHGDRVLPPGELAPWHDLWRKWLAFREKMEAAKSSLADESLAAKVLAATSPAYWASRALFATAQRSLALMSSDNKRELDSLLDAAWKLYRRFHLLGMSQVAVPYAGELVVLVRTLPKELALTDMASRLRDGARAGERLLDENTAWWQWRRRDETRGLVRAIGDAKELADAVERVSKTPPGRGTRDSGTPIYQKFLRTLAKIYVEAAGLYGVEETKATARAEAKEESKRGGERAAVSMGYVLAAAGLGYLGLRWLTRDKTTVVVRDVDAHDDRVGYHPDDAPH
jgi:hypothetical protein